MSEEPAHKVLTPETMEYARDGNRQGLASAYGQAAAWLRAGKAPPEELSVWLAQKLEALSAALRDAGDKKKHSILAAVGAVDAGRRGRKPASPLDDSLMSMIAWECHYTRKQTGQTWEAVFKAVAQKFADGRVFVSPENVKKAWRLKKREIFRN